MMEGQIGGMTAALRQDRPAAEARPPSAVGILIERSTKNCAQLARLRDELKSISNRTLGCVPENSRPEKASEPHSSLDHLAKLTEAEGILIAEIREIVERLQSL